MKKLNYMKSTTFTKLFLFGVIYTDRCSLQMLVTKLEVGGDGVIVKFLKMRQNLLNENRKFTFFFVEWKEGIVQFFFKLKRLIHFLNKIIGFKNEIIFLKKG